MIRPRTLQPSADLCCLPSPNRIPQCVAGMAFNFSKVEMSYRLPQRSRPVHPETTQSHSAAQPSRRRAVA